MVYYFQRNGAQPVAVPQILKRTGRVEEMVFVCDHCHFEIEAVSKPCQCPDCGKLNRIRTATAEEKRAFQARKLEDVWRDGVPVLVG